MDFEAVSRVITTFIAANKHKSGQGYNFYDSR